MSLRTLCFLCHMRAFRYRKYCVKGFFWEIIIVEGKWPTKIAKKSRKCVFLLNEKELEKVIEFRPQLFFNFRRGNTSSTFSNSCSLLRYVILGQKIIFQNIDFWEKSFYYSSFYTKKLPYGPESIMFWESSTSPNNLCPLTLTTAEDLSKIKIK